MANPKSSLNEAAKKRKKDLVVSVATSRAVSREINRVRDSTSMGSTSASRNSTNFHRQRVLRHKFSDVARRDRDRLRRTFESTPNVDPDAAIHQFRERMRGHARDIEGLERTEQSKKRKKKKVN
jgi:hypothetical protein